MQLKKLLEDDDAVSPVIGVILMVAITVILAAVIGTFVLGLGDQVQNTNPQASFTFDQGTYQVSGSTTEFTAVTITHDGGDKIEGTNLNVRVDGEEAYAADGSDQAVDPFTGTVSAGTSATIVAAADGTVETGSDSYTDETGGATDNGLRINDDDGADSDINDAQLTSDSAVRVVWSSPNGGDSATLGEYTIS